MSNRVPGATLQMPLPPGSNRTPSHALEEHFSLAKKKSLSHGSPTQDQRKLNPGKTHRSHLVNSTVILSAAKRSKKTWRDLQETPPPRSGRARRFALSLRRSATKPSRKRDMGGAAGALSYSGVCRRADIAPQKISAQLELSKSVSSA